MKEYSHPIPIYYLGHLIDCLNAHGYEMNSWLRKQGIELDQLIEEDIRINAEQLDSLLMEATKKGDFHDLGLDIGSRLQMAHHGTFGLALLNCENIKQVLEFVCQYLVIRVPFIELTMIEEGDEVIVLAKDNHWQGQLHIFYIEAVTSAMFNIFLAVKQRIPELALCRMLFDYPAPDYVDKYARFGSVSLVFDQAYCGLSLKKKFMDYTIPFVDRLSYLQAQRACQQELDRLLQFSTFTGKVQQCLMRFNHNRPTLQDVADSLNVSSRSLHRYLTAEGNSFKALLDEHQAKLAKQLLLTYGYSVSQTAASLGFVEIANFRRAFKRWYNCTPTDFIERAARNKTINE